MRSVFIEYLRSLEPRGGPPGSESFAELWEALGAVVLSEMSKRAQPGHGREPPERPDQDLEELTAECYAFIFIRRLRGLQAQLRVGSDIDGLIGLHVRHFLLDRDRDRVAGARCHSGPAGSGCQAVDSGRVSTMRRNDSRQRSGEGGDRR